MDSYPAGSINAVFIYIAAALMVASSCQKTFSYFFIN